MSTEEVRRTDARPIIAAAAVLALVFWFIEIDRAFDLPAHPLLIHVPLVLIPLLGLAAIAVGATDRHTTPVTAFAVVTLAFTLLAAGAGEAFLERLTSEDPRLADSSRMQDHADAGDLLRFSVFALTFVLVGLLFAKPPALRVALRVLIVLIALVAIFYTIRTGHLGAQLAWGPETS
jgi:uncharacterized membrane protein